MPNSPLPSLKHISTILADQIGKINRKSEVLKTPYGPEHIYEAVRAFSERRQEYRNALLYLESVLYEYEPEVRFHSIRKRVKDFEHLVEKLARKFLDKSKLITKDTLFTPEGVTDLGGIRILHIYKKQW